jgi:hypothetical protein
MESDRQRSRERQRTRNRAGETEGPREKMNKQWLEETTNRNPETIVQRPSTGNACQ